MNESGIMVRDSHQERMYAWGDFKGFVLNTIEDSDLPPKHPMSNHSYILLKKDSTGWFSSFLVWASVEVIVPVDRNDEVFAWLSHKLLKLSFKKYTTPFDKSVSIVLAMIVFPVLAIVLIWAFRSF